MSYIKIWIHFIWSTKNREKIINKELKYKLYDHIRENAKNKNIYLDYINGVKDHIHLLVSFNGEQSASKVAFLLKGESSYWINKNKLINRKFEWQEEFMAISISESLIPKVRKYIQTQEEHHKKLTYSEEYDIFIKKYAFDRFEAKAGK